MTEEPGEKRISSTQHQGKKPTGLGIKKEGHLTLGHIKKGKYKDQMKPKLKGIKKKFEFMTGHRLTLDNWLKEKGSNKADTSGTEGGVPQCNQLPEEKVLKRGFKNLKRVYQPT